MQPSTSGERWSEASRHTAISIKRTEDEKRTARRHEKRDNIAAHIARGTETTAASKQDGRQGGYHMSKLSASHHPVSNTRRHDNRDDDATPHEAKHPTAD